MSTAHRQHTPGPWVAYSDQLSRTPSLTWGINGFHPVAGFHSPQDCQLATVYDVEANARLIASAPDLLTALEATEAKLTQAARAFYGAGSAKALREAFEGWRATAEAARAAIARAVTGGNAS